MAARRGSPGARAGVPDDQKVHSGDRWPGENDVDWITEESRRPRLFLDFDKKSHVRKSGDEWLSSAAGFSQLAISFGPGAGLELPATKLDSRAVLGRPTIEFAPRGLAGDKHSAYRKPTKSAFR